MKRITLQEVTEPIFLYVCKINRVANSGGELSYLSARNEICELIESSAVKASRDQITRDCFQRIKIPLLLFIDYMIVDSGVNFAMQWHQCSLFDEFAAINSSDDFCSYIEEDLAQNYEGVEEVLLFYFLCVGLGYGGGFESGTSQISQVMAKLLPKIRNHINAGSAGRITQSAYENINTLNFIKPVGGKISLILAVFVIFMISVAISVIFMYKESSQGMVKSVSRINSHLPSSLK